MREATLTTTKPRRKRRTNTDPLVKPLLVDVGAALGGRGIRTTRREALPTRQGKQRMAVVAALYHAGFSYRDIEAQTGMSYATIRKDVALADKHFNLSNRLAQVFVRMDTEAVPLAVDNLIDTLKDAAPERQAAKDEATYKTLEGRGLFRQFNVDSGGEGSKPSTMALQVNFAAPVGMVLPHQQAQIVGAARASEADASSPAPVSTPAVPTPPVPADYTD